MEPKIKQIKNGWAALGDGWAVFGRDPDDARAKFADAERQHAVIRSRVVPTAPQPPSSRSLTVAQG